jgi:hypothetical protein
MTTLPRTPANLSVDWTVTRGNMKGGLMVTAQLRSHLEKTGCILIVHRSFGGAYRIHLSSKHNSPLLVPCLLSVWRQVVHPKRRWNTWLLVSEGRAFDSRWGHSISSLIARRLFCCPSAIGIATGYGLDGRWVGVRVPGVVRFFPSPRRPYRFWSPPTGRSFPWGKSAEAWSWPLTSI